MLPTRYLVSKRPISLVSKNLICPIRPLVTSRQSGLNPVPSAVARFNSRSSKMAQQYKLKINSLNLKDGEKREVEVDGIKDGKVLVVKVAGEVHAMSANCTHYGAPLVKGVVTGDGRLTCPWHGGMDSSCLRATWLTRPSSLLQRWHGRRRGCSGLGPAGQVPHLGKRRCRLHQWRRGDDQGQPRPIGREMYCTRTGQGCRRRRVSLPTLWN